MKKFALAVAVTLLTSVGMFAVPALATGGGDYDKPKKPHKVVLCHKDYHTIVVDRHAVRAHLAHGDYLGKCKPVPSPTEPTETPTETPTEPTPTPTETQPTDPPTETPPPTEEPTPTPTETEEPAPVVPKEPVGPRGAGTQGTLSDELPVTGPADTAMIAGLGGLLTLMGGGVLFATRRRKLNLS